MVAGLAACAVDSSANDQSVLDVMTQQITPATNKLWGAEDPQTDADWRALSNAASETAIAFRLTKTGGSGRNDNDWAANDDWQFFSDQMIKAAETAQFAIADRDIEALLAAGEPLYEPCEACHAVYLPGVTQQ